jgi:hypothetical protein
VPRIHLSIALTLAALGLAPGAAHVMELPVKLAYPPALYAAITSTLYAWYGIAGGAVQVAAVLSVAALAVRARRLPSGPLVVASAAGLLASLLVWGAIVAPVNAAWSEVAGAEPETFIAAYERLRPRWEFGHLAAFIAWLAGWLALVAAASRADRVSER